jgi:hypothetical protein
MTCRVALAYALFSSVFFAGAASAQPGDRYLDMKARVLEILFPLDVTPKPYFQKMVLRFSDSETQLVVVVYPDKDKYWIRKCEITGYGLDGMGKDGLSQFISKMVAENPNVKAQEIAARVKVNITRSSVPLEALDRPLDELKTIRISPVLADRVSVDEFSEYEFWYDNWQESVHYVITSPFGNDPQDQLGRWMTKFRDKLPSLLKASLGPTPAKPGRGEK